MPFSPLVYVSGWCAHESILWGYGSKASLLCLIVFLGVVGICLSHEEVKRVWWLDCFIVLFLP